MNPTQNQSKIMEEINKEYVNVANSFSKIAEYFNTLNNNTQLPQPNNQITPTKTQTNETEPISSQSKLRKRRRAPSKEEPIEEPQSLSIQRLRRTHIKERDAQVYPIGILVNGKKEIGYQVHLSYGKFKDQIGPFKDMKFSTLLKDNLMEEMTKMNLKTGNNERTVAKLIKKVKEQMYARFPPMELSEAKKQKEDDNSNDINEENKGKGEDESDESLNDINSKEYNIHLLSKDLTNKNNDKE